MALTLKTPGAYIEEISLLPPSVAAVGTAIPAFIGYTEIPGEISDDLPVPVRIGSMLEYESIFGSAQDQQGISATVVGDDIQVDGPDSNEKPIYLMYYSLQMYFANGGGPCYVASVGTYSTEVVDLSKLQNGLSAIEKEDEPTLLVFPDATSMSDADFYTIYKSAIEQCYKLQDRFTIMDTYNDNPINSQSYDPIAELRDGMNMTSEYLKYGASYYPFLSTLINYHYQDADVDVSITDESDYAAQAQLIADSVSTDSLNMDILNLISKVDSNPGALLTIKSDILNCVNAIISEISKVRNTINKAVIIGQSAPSDPTTDADILALQTWITNQLNARELQLNQAINAINSATTDGEMDDAVVAIGNTPPIPLSVYDILGAGSSPSQIVDDINIVGTTGPLGDLISSLPTTGGTTNTDLASIKDNENVLYNQIKAEISQLPLVLPPSSTMAGIYARVDNSNGVWTSPANVGLNYVNKPTYMVDNEQQEDLNVTSTGKSVNAIRTFTGRGTLVWGARTMAGNDNEWRYISVRRLFNFVEESIQKASEPFVFQANNANTWVRLRAMIENFLNLQWRAGALTGAKPDQAYYVRVGLGQTMTAEDILNGKMIIEIGLAAVRPAEFIVLKFSHKMQEA